MQKTFILRDAAILERAIAYLRSAFNAEHPVAVIVTPAERRRTLEQNDKLHKMLRVLQDEGWIKGQQGTVEEWKRLLLIKLGFVDWITDLDTGAEVPVPKRTSEMSVRELTELIERIQLYAAEHLGVEL
jgi:hypothetical protein